MSTGGILSSSFTQSNAVESVANASSTPRGPAATQRSAQFSTDTVTLSQAAQVHQLNVQGQSPSQIAANLGISVANVDADLGVVTKVTSIQAAPSAIALPKAAPTSSK
jgi:DNA-binding CsgD family transcriptional regulator